MPDILKEPFIVTALIAGITASAVCAYIGVFIILRRIVFMGMALTESAALGVALGLFFNINSFFAAAFIVMSVIMIFWFMDDAKMISKESFIGFIYVSCAALALLLIAKNPFIEAKGHDIISGNILYVTRTDLILLAAGAVLAAALHAVFFRKFIFISFDPSTALASGVNVRISDLMLYLSIGIVISFVTKVCGALFTFSSMLIPAMAGLVICHRIRPIFIISIITAVFCVIIGIVLSCVFDLSTSPVISGLYGVSFIFILALKKMRGV